MYNLSQMNALTRGETKRKSIDEHTGHTAEHELETKSDPQNLASHRDINRICYNNSQHEKSTSSDPFHHHQKRSLEEKRKL
jgi:hypothetical protein